MRNLLKKFRKDKKGVTAIEFSLFFPLILILSFYILETSWYYTRFVLFDSAVRGLTRQIYIGAVQAGGLTVNDVKDIICDDYILANNDCQQKLVLELTELTSLASLPSDGVDCIAVDPSNNSIISPVVDYDLGTGGSVVFVRACLTTDFLLPGIGLALNIDETNTGLFNIISKTAFINEPS